MAKALISIGVNKTTSSFPTLLGAAEDAKAMHAWGQLQGFHCKLFVDEGDNRVRAADLFDAVQSFVDKGTYSQIVVYFSGHGLLKSPECELWMLSGAPRNPNEVVNVMGSIASARGSRIEHIVFISDACRSLPNGMQLACMGPGQNLFAGGDYADQLPEVDVFYATIPGNLAHEIPPDISNPRDRGLLTEHLLNALEGKVPEVIRQLDEDGVSRQVVHCRPLKTWITSTVRKAAQAKGLHLRQVPDLRIESDPPKYLARVISTPNSVKPLSVSGSPPRLPAAAPASRNTSSRRGLIPSRGSTRTAPPPPRRHDLGTTTAIDARVASAQRLSEAILPDGSSANILVHGAQLASAFSVSGCELTTDGRTSWLHLKGKDDSTALRFTDGSGILIGNLPGFDVIVALQGKQVVTISYQPSAANASAGLADEIELRSWHAEVATAAAEGCFSVQPISGSRLHAHIDHAARERQALNPTLAIYASYAYARAKQFERIKGLYAGLLKEIGVVPFDVFLQAHLANAEAASAIRLAPAMPMMTQGWMFMGQFESRLPPTLQRAREFLMPSMWATFSPEGMNILERHLAQG